MAIDFSLPPELDELRGRVRAFIDDVVRPAEQRIDAGTLRETDKGAYYRELLALRSAARQAGLWLPQMPPEWGGMGLGHVALAMVQAEAARTYHGPWVLNCQAPDEGNMHTLLHFGTDEQKERYLRPLCEGTVWSCFAMTEPEVAGSDPTLIQTRAERDGDGWVINGHKWFISNAHRANFAIVIARTEEDPEIAQAANTAFIVDLPADGWTEVRQIETMHGGTGHSEIRIEDLRVADTQRLGGRGEGHRLGQYRLGPARLAHCMRWIAQAEVALDMMVDRSLNRFSHGSLLAEKQGVQWLIADSTMELYQAKLMVLHAAYKLDRAAVRRHRRVQVGGVDGQALRRQHAQPGDRPLDPGARRARLLHRHAVGAHVPARPLGAPRRRRRRDPPDAHRRAGDRRLPRHRQHAAGNRRPAHVSWDEPGMTVTVARGVQDDVDRVRHGGRAARLRSSPPRRQSRVSPSAHAVRTIPLSSSTGEVSRRPVADVDRGRSPRSTRQAPCIVSELVAQLDRTPVQLCWLSSPLACRGLRRSLRGSFVRST